MKLSRRFVCFCNVIAGLCIWICLYGFGATGGAGGNTSSHLDDFVKWLKPCEKVLFDLGANRGDTIERWFSDLEFGGRNKGGTTGVGSMFPSKVRKDFCVVSFEPNPRFTNTLRAVSKVVAAGGHRTKDYTNTAAGDEDGTILLHVDETSTQVTAAQLQEQEG